MAKNLIVELTDDIDGSVIADGTGESIEFCVDGVDYAIDKNWLINVDVKYIWISTDVSAAGSKLTTLDINPWVVGLGVGYRF